MDVFALVLFELRRSEMKRNKLLLVVIVGMLFVASQAWAGWASNESYQAWDFTTNANPAIPEINENPFGTPTATITSTETGAPPQWLAETLGRDGVWTSNDRLEVSLYIPNQEIRNPYKKIIVEISYIGELNGTAIYTNPFADRTTSVPEGSSMVVGTDGWVTRIDEFRIEPNPDEEWINYHWLGEEIGLDYVNVYTICVPEPMTIALLGFGGLMLRRRRKA